MAFLYGYFPRLILAQLGKLVYNRKNVCMEVVVWNLRFLQWVTW